MPNLVVLRRPEQAVVLILPDGQTVRIKAQRFHGQVKVAIDAPATVTIVRDELLDMETPAA